MWGVTVVDWDLVKPYKAQFRWGDRTVYAGYHETAQAAHEAAKAKKQELVEMWSEKRLRTSR